MPSSTRHKVATVGAAAALIAGSVVGVAALPSPSSADSCSPLDFRSYFGCCEYTAQKPALHIDGAVAETKFQCNAEVFNVRISTQIQRSSSDLRWVESGGGRHRHNTDEWDVVDAGESISHLSPKIGCLPYHAYRSVSYVELMWPNGEWDYGAPNVSKVRIMTPNDCARVTQSAGLS